MFETEFKEISETFGEKTILLLFGSFKGYEKVRKTQEFEEIKNNLKLFA